MSSRSLWFQSASSVEARTRTEDAACHESRVRQLPQPLSVACLQRADGYTISVERTTLALTRGGEAVVFVFVDVLARAR